MTDRLPFPRPPLTLIVNSHEWYSRSLESILGPQGYAVLRAYNGRQALDRAASARPDLIIVDIELPDQSGVELCEQLRVHASVSPCTPILMTTSGQVTRAKRLEALRAGAWDLLGAALDGEELPLRLEAYVRSKQEADRVREESLLDELTGLYNLRGLARRAREVGSQAFRDKQALACLVVAPLIDAGESSSVTERLGRVLQRVGRTSDVLGAVGPGEFAIVAHGTNSEGAARFAERLATAAAEMFAAEGIRVAVGFDAVPNYQEAPIDPTDLLTRASAAMRALRLEGTGPGMPQIRRFEGSQLN